jgi:hypothetical protein
MITGCISPVRAAAGATFQHQALRRRKDRSEPEWAPWRCLPVIQEMNAVNSAFFVTSTRDCVLEAPHDLHRHLVRPALVEPFFTSF